MDLREQIKYFKESITGSYCQIFFSNNPYFALFVFVSSLIDYSTGFCGLLSVLISILFSRWMGFNPILIRKGSYSYNSLLVGLGIGASYNFNFDIFIVLILASLITVLLSVQLSSLESKYKIPFLSLPFVIGIWIIFLSIHSFDSLQIHLRTITSLLDEIKINGLTINGKISSLPIPFFIEAYFKSLGAIFFQYNIVSGIIIAIGLFFYSRIAFSLSVLGCLAGCIFCFLFQSATSSTEFSYIGFNFILTFIALGGFYLVPSSRSYLLALLAVPILALIIFFLQKFFGIYYLPLYSMPFVLVVMLFLGVLKSRYYFTKLHLVEYQQSSPEKNLYAYTNNLERFKNDTYYHIHLPFFGEWLVSQGHDGNITHKEDWKYAWDFVVTDETQKTFRLPGTDVDNFFCYALPLLAPCSGYVENIIDGVDDNEIGNVNMKDNWGNTIVIKHGDYLFSKISHIKKGSFKVKKGDYVKKGDTLALSGNSGRSPEPHIHFQLQTTPYVGAKTLKYPISYYVSKQNGKYSFHSFDYPEEGQQLVKASPTPLISNSFTFVPGMIFNIMVERNNSIANEKWEVFTDASNHSYIYCYETKSIAYFVNNETLHYFTNFKGDYNSLLYYFYLGANKILLSYFKDIQIYDSLPIAGFFKGSQKWMQDIIAPFKIYFKADYTSSVTEIDSELNPSKITIASLAISKSGDTEKRKIEFEMNIEDNRICIFTIKEKDQCIKATFIE